MVDLGTGLALYSGKEILVKLLGPTADYLGGEMASYTEKALKNLRRIFSKAVDTLGDKINDPGQVPPRVLKGILSEGPFCEDELSGEYFGGVLASSRTGIDRDDRGAVFTKLVSSMSTYQIRTHYFLYTILRKGFLSQEFSILITNDRAKMKMFVPHSVYLAAMDFQQKETAIADVLFDHASTGLERSQLMQINAGGSLDFLSKQFPRMTFPEPGFVFSPTAQGAELYLWAHGKGDVHLMRFFHPTIEIAPKPEVSIPDGACAFQNMLRD